jgi:hypothetical protein
MAEAQGGVAEALATIAGKAGDDGLRALAAERGLAVLAVAVEGVETPTQSARIHAMHGTGSVAEAAAIVPRGRAHNGGAGDGAGRNGHGGHGGQGQERGDRMTVHFIGAGPGAADLITLRGRDLIAACPVCLYAGSLVPEALLSHCPPGARIVNTAPLSLDQIIEEIAAAHAAGQDVARLHSGDLSVWSAMGEQLRRLRALGIPYDVTPGVPSFAAAAAVLGAELTLPGVAQSVVLTRTQAGPAPCPRARRWRISPPRGRRWPFICRCMCWNRWWPT